MSSWVTSNSLGGTLSSSGGRANYFCVAQQVTRHGGNPVAMKIGWSLGTGLGRWIARLSATAKFLRGEEGSLGRSETVKTEDLNAE